VSFRELVASMDDAVEQALLDDGIIDGRPVCGKFDAKFLDVRIGTLRTDLTQPKFSVRNSRLGNTAEGSVVEVMGEAFEVVSLEADGDDWTTLNLRPTS
jgi:hypothetical protein